MKRELDWRMGAVSAVSYPTGEDRANLKCKAFDLLVSLHPKPPLWSWNLKEWGHKYK